MSYLKNISPDKLIQEIYSFRKKLSEDFNIIDVFIEFAHRKDIDLRELGEMISESKYLEIIEDELKANNYLSIKKFEEEW